MARSHPRYSKAASTLLCGMLWIHPAAQSAEEPAAPALALANPYHADVDLGQYLVSEKFDGIRGYWNGRQLLSRAGNVIHAPAWFIERLPPIALDGELWMGPRQFEATVAVVRDLSPDEAEWRRIRFMVFDLPGYDAIFAERQAALQALLVELDVPWLQAVAQRRIDDETALRALLQQIVRAGGEGVMLHRADARYRGGRSDDLLKLKPSTDAEAVVVGYLPGKGKYQGLLGALIVERPDGLRFRLGTGLSDAQRHNPPPLGAAVTYSFQGMTARGVPRFARLLRLRDADL